MDQKKVNKATLLRDLAKEFVTPGSPIFFAGINQIHSFYERKLTREEIKDFLIRNNAYVLHKEYKTKNASYSPTFAYSARSSIQADLLEVGKYAVDNDKIRYIMAILDAFTRRAWLVPLETKSGPEVLAAFKSILENEIEPISDGATLCTDEGGEWFSNKMKLFLKEKKIKHKVGRALGHCGIVERFLRSLSRLIRQYMTHNGTRRYIDDLQNILETYNGRVSHLFFS